MVEYGGSSTATASTAASNITTVGTGATTLGTYQVNDGSTITAADAATAGLVDGAGHAITTDLTAGQLFYVATKGTDLTSYSAPASFDAITNAHKVTSDSQKAAASDLAVFGNASGVNILTQADALSAIDSIDKAMLQVNVAQIQQGATQNRLQAIISTLTSSNESTINARSHIMDTDFAAETASMARAQILQQAGMAMLAQANTSNNGIMALMR